VFTARYALSPYIKQILSAFKGLIVKFNFRFRKATLRLLGISSFISRVRITRLNCNVWYQQCTTGFNTHKWCIYPRNLRIKSHKPTFPQSRTSKSKYTSNKEDSNSQPFAWTTSLFLLVSKSFLFPIYLSDIPCTTLHNAIYESSWDV
jgi:hypothetical protein